MSFFDLLFWVFVLAALVIYYLVPGKLQKYVLLAASIVFYALCGLQACIYIALVMLVIWSAALLLSSLDIKKEKLVGAHKSDRETAKKIKQNMQTRKRIVFWTALTLPLLLLCLVKYGPALTEALGLPGVSLVLRERLLLALGISFYTFQALGYLIDVYNGDYPAERNLARFALFIAYFPQLVQGPISRYNDLGEQFRTPKKLNMHLLKNGVILVLWGAFKKLAIADRLAPFVNHFTSGAFRSGGAAAIVTVFFYAIQLYADFSGGIDIARGISTMFGIHLQDNFKRPYFAVSMADFWRRWHITLGTWMRDYLFYPLATCKPMRTLSKKIKKRNVYLSRVFPAIIGNLIVFFVVGVWHGAKLTFIAWGLYNGILLAVSSGLERRYETFQSKHARLVNSKEWHVFRVIRTFILVLIGYFFDCAASLRDSVSMLHAVFTSFRLRELMPGSFFTYGISRGGMVKLVMAIVPLILVSVLQERRVDVVGWINRRNLIVRSVLYSLLIVLFLFLTSNGYKDAGGFMYAIF